MSSAVPIPLSDPIARPRRDEFIARGRKDPQEGLITQPWVDFFTDMGLDIQAAPSRLKVVSLSSQGASIGATDMTDGTLSAGLYRLSYYARITRPATTSSSLTVTFDWTDGGVTPSYSGAAITGNTTTTIQSGTVLIRVSALSPVRYSTTYASVGGTTMQYSLDIVLEQVSA